MSKDAPNEVLNAMPYGFYIVGVVDEGQANGFTANWVSQVSFRPAYVTVSVHNDHHSHDAIEGAGVFSVNLLDESQEELARTFAEHQEPGEDSVAGVQFSRSPETGSPLFDDSFAHLECRVADKMKAGNHTVYLGEVVGADFKREADILTSPQTSLHYEEE